MSRTSRMLAALGIGAALAFSGLQPVSADGPDLRIRSDFVFSFETLTATGTFRASGEEVRDGDVCRRGAAYQEFQPVEADDEGPVKVVGTDEYTCADGSGTIVIQFEANRHTADETGHHFDLVGCIVGGTGEYDDLEGVAGGSAHADLPNNTVSLDYRFSELDDDANCPLS